MMAFFSLFGIFIAFFPLFGLFGLFFLFGLRLSLDSSRRLKKEKSKEAIVFLLRNAGKYAFARVIAGPWGTPGKKTKELRPFLVHQRLRVKKRPLDSNSGTIENVPSVNGAFYHQSIAADCKE